MAIAATLGRCRPAAPSDRTTVRRLPERGDYDRETHRRHPRRGADLPPRPRRPRGPPVRHPDDPRPGRRHALPARLAGAAGRCARPPPTASTCCVAVTIVDGLVLARSAFHHSMNYRSVVVYGRADRGRRPRREARRPRRPRRARPRRPRRRLPRAEREGAAAARSCCGSRSTRRRPRCAPAARSTTTRTSTCRCGPATCRCGSSPASPSPNPSIAGTAWPGYDLSRPVERYDGPANGSNSP